MNRAALIDHLADQYSLSRELCEQVAAELLNAFDSGRLAGQTTHADDTNRLLRALEERHRADLGAVAEGLGRGFARELRGQAERDACLSSSLSQSSEPLRQLVEQASLLLRHEWQWLEPMFARLSGSTKGPPECPECGGVKPDEMTGPWRSDLRPRGHQLVDGKPCGWGELCEQLRLPVLTAYPSAGINFLMGERAEAGAIVTFNEKGHLVPRSKLP